MLKTTRLFNKLALSKNNGNRPSLKKNKDNGEVRFNGNSIEHTKKLGKLKY